MMDSNHGSVKAEHLRRTDVAWYPDAGEFAGVAGIGAPAPDLIAIRFQYSGGEGTQVFALGEEVPLKKKGIDAQRVIDRLCVPEGETASSWRSERREDHTFHAGFVLVDDGYQFVTTLAGWRNEGHIRLLTHGGEFPYSYSLADDLCLAMIDYCEGDIAVRAFTEAEPYVRALDLYLRGPLESHLRRVVHERVVSRALRTGTFPGTVEFES